MSQHFSRIHRPSRPARLAGVLATLLCAGTAMAAAPVAAPDLRVCVDQASPGAALDTRLADAVAQVTHGATRVHAYRGVPHGDDAGFELRNYRQMLAAECDLVLGFPQSMAADAGALPDFLRATAPYASTGFVLVTRVGMPAPAGLAALPAQTRLGVAYNSLPNVFFAHHDNLLREILADDAEAIAAVASKALAGAIVWQPAAAQQLELHRSAATLRFTRLDEPYANYRLVALYGASGEAAAHRFEAAIDELRRNGTLARTLQRYASAEQGAPSAVLSPPRHPHRAQLLAGIAHGNPPCAAAKAAPGKAPPALYTQAQADAGKQLFAENCALCHGADLEGRNGPMLKGKMFLPAAARHTVGDIFTIVAQNMPATAPGSLQPEQYVKLMAFLLQQNGYPAGSAELGFDAAFKSTVLLVYRAP